MVLHRREQLARIEAMVAGGAGARLCLYSGHDFTVFPLMLCLVPGWGEGAEDTIGGGLTQWTPFAGDVSSPKMLKLCRAVCLANGEGVSPLQVATELWRDEQGGHQIRVRYRGEPLILEHTDGEGFCSLDAFRAYLAPVTQTDAARL